MAQRLEQNIKKRLLRNLLKLVILLLIVFFVSYILFTMCRVMRGDAELPDTPSEQVVGNIYDNSKLVEMSNG